MAAAAQLRCSTVGRHHYNPSDNRRFSDNPNSSISFPYSKTQNRPLSFVPKPIWVQTPEHSFSGGNGGGGAGAGGSSGGWSRGGDGNSDDSSSSSSSVSGFGVLGMFLNGWRSRVAADPQFPFKVLMEEVVGVSSCVLGDMASRPNFGLNELDFVFSTLVVGCILNFTLMYLLAPTLSASAATLPSIFASCPASHMFEPGSYGLMNRLGTFVYKGTVFAAVGFVAGLAGTALSNGLIKLRKKMDPNFETPNKAPPTLLNALTWAAHMGLSSNLRYQTLNGAEFLLEKGLPPLAFKSSVVVLRCLNNVLGGMSFVVLARLTGSQSVAEKPVEVEVGSAEEKEKLVVAESEDGQSNQSTFK
ncbi:LOW QUALITY PROTEIN: protein RETICULATA-RELATED 3, chloroplastic-like [Pyrus x bretschneideri]|uniref:LOW QUALITY PROTEIN: protein RETICULATA-RELATED 3, chloroplastic-like n=1 Tax=Pyrus x bretschneideri TaxID=225117 RepID=UPI00202FAD62|nr:LOW QUALITY PROTEIN: protein RETICULATA-RELATED 3, chloroplastic-like [Pyrus x bretschneideri]